MATPKELASYQRNAALERLILTADLAKGFELDSDNHANRALFKSRCAFLGTHYDEFRLAHQSLLPLLDADEFDDADAKCKRADEAYFLSDAVFTEWQSGRTGRNLSPPQIESSSATPNAAPTAQTSNPPIAENINSANATNSGFSNATNTQQVTASGSQSTLSARSSNIANVRLPKLTLPRFDGNSKTWQTFRDMYNSLIHENDTISNVEKFQYLISSLSGTALTVVGSLPINNDNYVIAYEALLKRYQNDRLLASEHWRAIQQAQIVTSESAESLQKLVDIFNKNLGALKLLGLNTAEWDFVLFNLLLDKLDIDTKKSFEKQYTKSELPSYDELYTFVVDHSNALARIKKPSFVKFNNESKGKPSSYNSRIVKVNTVTVADNTRECPLCKQVHFLSQCEAFLKLTAKERHLKVRELRLCNNCLRSHFVKNCQSKSNCKTCNLRHHTLLHFTNAIDTRESFIEAVPSTSSTGPPSTTTALTNITNHQTILATALVKISDVYGKLHTCRCLLDAGSQSNFISEALVNKLGLHRLSSNVTIQGINKGASRSSSLVRIDLSSQYMQFRCSVSCLVLPTITSNLPSVSFMREAIAIPENIVLADAQFFISSQVDILIGATLFYELLLPGRISLGKNLPILQEFKLGWIISGDLPFLSLSNKTSSLTATLTDDVLIRFWQVEEPQLTKSVMSLEDKECEKHFESTTIRDAQGRFIVRVPFNDKLSQLGDSREQALRRFYHLETKLSRSTSLREQYVNFMSEYLTLGHMTELVDNNLSSGYFIPHHSVVKDSISTKLRVVFDASMPTTSGISLNQTQLVGPVVQSDLLAIILRFRQHTYVFAGDIKMMYRQILLAEDQRKYQRIFWRFNKNEDVKVYELNTVTYGTASAPYLATRCLKSLSDQFKSAYPLAAHTIAQDFYVDDLITGSDCLVNLLKVRDDILSILESAQLQLRKFRSNTKNLLTEGISLNDDLQVLSFGEYENAKTLGVGWNSYGDQIQFHINNNVDSNKIPTKRQVLSVSSSIFDPLGLVSPVIILAKILIQILWDLKLGWDDPIPEYLQKQWFEWQSNLPLLNACHIRRKVLIDSPVTIELHGFSDASEKAYGATVYVRSIDSSNNIESHLLISKSKVAPLRKISLPRLELCGAYLLVNLLNKVKMSMTTLNVSQQYCWTDSTIVLNWLKASPSRWKTFVANRVAFVQEHTNISEWGHVKSEENPADLVSRGVCPSILANSSMWWNGPSFLHNITVESPIVEEITIQDLPEAKNSNVCCFISSIVPANDPLNIFTRFSSYSKLVRVVAFILRWKARAVLKMKGSLELTCSEIKNSNNTLVKLAQQQSFGPDIHSLQRHNEVPSNSRLLSLNPFLDRDHILRVGGRLRNASIPFDTKHQILLCNKHPFTEMLLRHTHLQQWHCGPQALLYTARQRYWPLNARNLVRKITRGCITCFRVKPTTNANPIMGNLPFHRLEPQPPFYSVGVDYAGPILTKTHKLRNAKLIKVYIALFICMVTKAIHLELVSELTTEAFMAALRRFVARRGKPAHIYSDNGTNFVGADRELRELYVWISSVENQEKVAKESTLDGIQWHFIPSHSPTFGGLWEAGVKSVKHHLKRVLGNINVTFEAMYTILVQIEAILNSRPISPLSNDPNDLLPLTPAHFLIGRSLMSIPEQELMEVPPNRLNHYQLLQQCSQHFWSRWNKEYINELQTRQKWKKHHTDTLKVGSLVLLKEDNLPPLRWKLGRVTQLHPGRDHVNRVVSVKTVSGSDIKRAVSKVCVLPLQQMQES